VTPAEIEHLQTDLDQGRWGGRDAAILAVVDELHERGDLDDATWDRLRGFLDERRAIELLLLVGHYEMLATTITTLRIQPDVHG
jgi:hypothetical protein